MKYILNAFSANMLADTDLIVSFRRFDPKDVYISDLDEYVSAVGHAETATLFGKELETPVAHNRVNVSLKIGDTAILGQYIGPRLPEGATELPAGARIDWFRVVVMEGDYPVQYAKQITAHLESKLSEVDSLREENRKMKEMIASWRSHSGDADSYGGGVY